MVRCGHSAQHPLALSFRARLEGILFGRQSLISVMCQHRFSSLGCSRTGQHLQDISFGAIARRAAGVPIPLLSPEQAALPLQHGATAARRGSGQMLSCGARAPGRKFVDTLSVFSYIRWIPYDETTHRPAAQTMPACANYVFQTVQSRLWAILQTILKIHCAKY